MDWNHVLTYSWHLRVLALAGLTLTLGGCGGGKRVYGNMFDYPGGKIISYSLFRPKGYYVNEWLKTSTEDIADEFIKVTNIKGK